MSEKRVDERGYWRANLKVVCVLLSIWAATQKNPR